MTYNEYEESVMQSWLVRTGMLPWMGSHVVKYFIKYLFDNNIVVDAITSSMSTYRDGHGVMCVYGKCTYDGKEKELAAEFRCKGAVSEALLDLGSIFKFADTIHSNVWLESVDVFESADIC
jgi:hypothetical protein